MYKREHTHTHTHTPPRPSIPAPFSPLVKCQLLLKKQRVNVSRKIWPLLKSCTFVTSANFAGQTTVQRVSLSTHKPLYRGFHYQLTNHCTEGFTINLQATVQVLLSTHQPLYKGFSLSDHKALYRAFHYQLTSNYTDHFTINSKANVQKVSLSNNKPLYKRFYYQLANHCAQGFTINYQLSSSVFSVACSVCCVQFTEFTTVRDIQTLPLNTPTPFLW